MASSTTATKNTFKIDIQLSGQNRARLQAKRYDKDYTSIPNAALPKTLKSTVSTFYTELTGEDFPLTDSTFLVKSKQGSFQRVYSPSVFRNPETDKMAIKWDNTIIPLSVVDGAIKVDTTKNKKLKIKLVSEPFGKFAKTCLSVTFTKDGDIYNMLFPLRSLTLEDELDVDELEILLEDDPTSLVARLMELSTGSNDDGGYKGSSERLEGEHLIKVSALPLGDYVVTGFRRYQNNYGPQHLLQLEAPETSFDAITRCQDENEEWVDKEVTIDKVFLVKANSRLNKVLMSDPIVDAENPARLTVLEKGEFNGYPTATVDFEPVAYTIDDELFDIDFA